MKKYNLLDTIHVTVDGSKDSFKKILVIYKEYIQEVLQFCGRESVRWLSIKYNANGDVF